MNPIKGIFFLGLMAFTLLVMGATVSGQSNSEPIYWNNQYSGNPYYPEELNMDGNYQDQTPKLDDAGSQTKLEYSNLVPSGAPVPVVPNDPTLLGLQIPSEPTMSSQAPSSEETDQTLIPADESFAKRPNTDDKIDKTDYLPQTTMITPTDVGSPNKFYVNFASQMSASSHLSDWLPIWLQVYSSGPIWIYEWYPDGRLDVKYLGYSYPGWYKRWFHSNVPGWHVLQYYSGGWSNYIYIYVYGSEPLWWNGPVVRSGIWPHHEYSSYINPRIGVDISPGKIKTGRRVVQPGIDDPIPQGDHPGEIQHSDCKSPEGCF
jgi:hypothetical protein